MSNFDVSACDEFLKTMQNGLAESVSSFARTFGTNITLAVGESGDFDPKRFGDAFKTKGLLLLPCTGGKAAAILIPKSKNLIPDWCDAPDATEKSKLTTLAQEWGMSFFPDEFFPDDFQAATVPDLLEVTLAGKIGEKPGYISLKLTSDSGETGDALLVWPLEQPAAVFASVETKKPATSSQSGPEKSEIKDKISQASPDLPVYKNEGHLPLFGANDLGISDEKQITLDDLPGFTRSVLKVKIPVAAVLAQSKRPIKMILELGVGSVIQFDKACDTFLDLKVGQLNIGTGEAVKVGDKFGLRIQSIQLPTERFRAVEVRKEGEYKRRKRGPAIIGKAPFTSLEPNTCPESGGR